MCSFIEPEQSIRKLTTASARGSMRSARNSRRSAGEAIRAGEAPAVDAAFFERAVPAVGGRLGKQRAQFACEPRQVHALGGDAAVELLAVFAQSLGAHQRACRQLAVVVGRVDAVAARVGVEHAAAAGDGGGGLLGQLGHRLHHEGIGAAFVVGVVGLL